MIWLRSPPMHIDTFFLRSNMCLIRHENVYNISILDRSRVQVQVPVVHRLLRSPLTSALCALAVDLQNVVLIETINKPIHTVLVFPESCDAHFTSRVAVHTPSIMLHTQVMIRITGIIDLNVSKCQFASTKIARVHLK